MAKKKLFGNTKEPRCETCSIGKRSADGESVLCIHGGAVPLSHHCRRYRYDPLRRTPKRRPLLGEYSAADFALDELTPEAPAQTETPVTEHQTLDKVFDYLNTHESPDADTIKAILTKQEVPRETLSAEAEALLSSLDNKSSADQEESAPATPEEDVLQPDDSPDIFGDLERLNMETVRISPAFRLHLADESKDDFTLLTLNDAAQPEALFISERNIDEEDAPLRANDLLLLSAEDLRDRPDEETLHFNEDGSVTSRRD